MCLHISKKLHPTAVPFTTERPILVWKYLGKSPSKSSNVLGSAPYLGTNYYHGKRMRAKFGVFINNTVNSGLHAMRRKEKKWLLPFTLRLADVYPAIIPVGSQVYLSEGNDIVSTQLIVYRDMKSLEAVHGTPDKGTKVSAARKTFLK